MVVYKILWSLQCAHKSILHKLVCSSDSIIYRTDHAKAIYKVQIPAIIRSAGHLHSADDFDDAMPSY